MFRKRRSSPPPAENFLERVQRHENTWGTEAYPQKPNLADILSAKVAVFWLDNDGKEQREKITLHPDTREVEFVLAKQVLRSTLEVPEKRLRAIYQNQKRLRIKAFKVVFEEIAE